MVSEAEEPFARSIAYGAYWIGDQFDIEGNHFESFFIIKVDIVKKINLIIHLIGFFLQKCGWFIIYTIQMSASALRSPNRRITESALLTSQY